MIFLSHSLCVSRPPGKPAASLQRQHRPWRVLGGVLQQLRGEVQEIRAAVGEARRQTVRAARLAATWVMVVVVVSVRPHPSHQAGHGAFYFADHPRRSAKDPRDNWDAGRYYVRENSTEAAIVSGSAFSSLAPCDSPLKAGAMFSSVQQEKGSAAARCCSPQEAGLQEVEGITHTED